MVDGQVERDSSVSQGVAVKVRFHPPPAALQDCFTTFYLVELDVPDGGRITDHLHPEWANLRFYSGDLPDAETACGMRVADTCFAATGPSARAVRFSLGATRMWGVGLLPLGWAKFVRASAAEVADVAVDGKDHPAFASFRPLAETLFGPKPDPEAELARITAHFLERADDPVPDEDRILAIHAALVDPDVRNVSDLVERSGISQRTLERTCHRAFGFSPKLLLRRQRFMRSLADFMLDPSLKWIGAIDSHYHDQAQFVRDFRQFMGMAPRQYAALPKPLLGAIMHERARYAGSAVQTLDRPGRATSGG